MPKVTVVIPNFNGCSYLPRLYESLGRQTCSDFCIMLVDNGSKDESVAWTRDHFPQIEVAALPCNTGFAAAVNEGIRRSRTPYVLLLNNDTEVEQRFVEKLLEAIEAHPRAIAVQAKLLRFDQRDRIDDAGDFYCALGWAYARGKGKNFRKYNKEERIFACCAGAAIYRRQETLALGAFDEEYFAYLEDIDLGYRARIQGMENWYQPDAIVYHVGSGTSGSRYNEFKVRYSSRNNVYMIGKNMPLPQLLLNLPFLAAGFIVKQCFFLYRGMGREYLAGIWNGLQLSRKGKKAKFEIKNLKYYIMIQWELWMNTIRRFL
ncbi:MAG: glycosyltransferase family 2 protein [Blautia sp.]|nr:glycosyltransferase family 2 protein [Blautia sp.]